MKSETKTENKILAKRAIFRANSGFHFIKACLDYFHKDGTDPAYSRSLYVLFSYNFELMLKARILLASQLTDRKNLVASIKSHDLKNLSKKLSYQELRDIGINNIKKIQGSDFKEYEINLLDDKQLLIQEFTDVRYDFGKDALRMIDQEESKRMKEEIEVLLSMTKKIMEML